MGEAPVLEAYSSSLIPNAEAFIKAYDEAERFDVKRKSEKAEGERAREELLTAIRSWLPLLLRDIPSFDASAYGDRPVVADDVISDAERLIESVEAFTDEEGNPLPYKEVCVQKLSEKLVNAIKEHKEAESVDSEYQKLCENRRVSADAVDRDLVSFRRTLAALVGTSDADYQKLRVSRASVPDKDDDPKAPAPPTDVEPASPNDPPPVK